MIIRLVNTRIRQGNTRTPACIRANAYSGANTRIYTYSTRQCAHIPAYSRANTLTNAYIVRPLACCRLCALVRWLRRRRVGRTPQLGGRAGPGGGGMRRARHVRVREDLSEVRHAGSAAFRLYGASGGCGAVRPGGVDVPQLLGRLPSRCWPPPRGAQRVRALP